MERRNYRQEMKVRECHEKNLTKCLWAFSTITFQDEGEPNLFAIKCLERGECFYHEGQEQEH